MRKTKIVATIGPASRDPRTLLSLIKAGVDVCRLNFSFGTHEEHRRSIAAIREASRLAGKPVAILADLQGPKIRIGQLKEPVKIRRGETITLTGASAHPEPRTLPTTYTRIARDTARGKTILMADGAIRVKVIDTDPAAKTVRCKVETGGTIRTGKGINLPYTRISLPSLTAKDRKDAAFAAREDIDYIALSFVRKAADITGLERHLKKNGRAVPVIAKIEKPEALDSLEEICRRAFGVMVARGDLGVELSFARVPVEQKRIIKTAAAAGRLVITATQMLESMIEHPMPTRAEAADVANAVYDGTDAVMLSGETATGAYPREAVEAMALIAEAADAQALCNRHTIQACGNADLRSCICEAAAGLSMRIQERGLVVFSRTGETARILSKLRPDTVIFAAATESSLLQRMALYHNVLPVTMGTGSLSDPVRSLRALTAVLKKRRLVKPGDRLIILTGSAHRGTWSTESIHVERV